MGQQKSKQMTEIVSEIIVNNTINTSKSCAQRAINVQNIVIRSTGTVKIDELVLKQGAFTTLNCVMESTQEVGFDAELATTLTNEILQEMGWGATNDQKAVIENNIKNIIKVDNLIEDIQSTFQSVMNEQNLLIEAKDDGQIIFGSIYVEQAIEASAESLMVSKAVIDIATYIENDVENIVEQELRGFDAIVDAIIGFFTTTIGMMVLLAIVAMVVFGWIFGGSSPEVQSQMLKSGSAMVGSKSAARFYY